jgi:hypothetical protein
LEEAMDLSQDYGTIMVMVVVAAAAVVVNA